MQPLTNGESNYMPKLIILGSSGYSKVVIDIVEKQKNCKIAGFVNKDGKEEDPPQAYPVLGKDSDLPQLIKKHKVTGIVIAIGDNFIRYKVSANIAKLCPNLEFPPLIHPMAVIAGDVLIGKGTVVMAGAVVNSGSNVGDFCLINTNSSLDHDNCLGDYASIAPRVATGGNCNIGTHSSIGIGAVLKHGITIGEHTVLGAGSLVLCNIKSHVTAYGSPAVAKTWRVPGDKYL